MKWSHSSSCFALLFLLSLEEALETNKTRLHTQHKSSILFTSTSPSSSPVSFLCSKHEIWGSFISWLRTSLTMFFKWSLKYFSPCYFPSLDHSVLRSFHPSPITYIFIWSLSACIFSSLVFIFLSSSSTLRPVFYATFYIFHMNICLFMLCKCPFQVILSYQFPFILTFWFSQWAIFLQWWGWLFRWFLVWW